MSFYSNLPISPNEGDNKSSLYPTIFEILSAQEIDSLLPASIRYILTNYWVARYPSRLTLALNNYFPEWFGVALKGLVEWHHINRYDSTFIEKFYGLQMFNSTNKVLMKAQMHSMENENASMKHWPKGLCLKQRQKHILFLERIILPYLGQKLDDLSATLAAQSAFNNSNNVFNLKSWLVETVYPLWKKIWYFTNLVTRLAFLSGSIGSITFLDYLFNIEYTRIMLPLKPSDSANSRRLKASASRPQKTNLYALWSRCSVSLSKLNELLSYSGSQLLPAFILMLRVYQWWTTQDISAKLERKLNNVDKDIPRSYIGSEESVRSTGICPICKNEIQNPCILETGYAACYPCAIDFLPKNEGNCPVTGKRLLGCQYDKDLGKWKVITGVRRLLV
ncbi:hypothetical protein HG535_0G03410 [Zygotorulaspora mrakii]|uniref:Peroxisome assembly protein 12 n=1 Tax=Zygotorulaspora mrakii TaxID=42260 RepID=A0A7H9B6V9_ZYGMR|nr:uncharacterized protein HG535_0G03410 [Zygotorulaspora mrakii]QLG74458.1 hypothetical protein HG535_0G03410 [Zygotorulaspora mrakii]